MVQVRALVFLVGDGLEFKGFFFFFFLRLNSENFYSKLVGFVVLIFLQSCFFLPQV